MPPLLTPEEIDLITDHMATVTRSEAEVLLCYKMMPVFFCGLIETLACKPQRWSESEQAEAAQLVLAEVRTLWRVRQRAEHLVAYA